MKDRKLYVDGELYLTLELVAEMYEVQIVVLQRAYELGLFGSGVESGSSTCIAAVQMDRVAHVIRWHGTLGVDVETIAGILPIDS